MDTPREVPFHESANRPNLLLGGDRELVLVFAIMAAMLVFSEVAGAGRTADAGHGSSGSHPGQAFADNDQRQGGPLSAGSREPAVPRFRA